MPETILKIESLTKRFDALEVLKDITLSVKERSITSLIGPNGSGKSTLFSIINGLIRSDKGMVYMREENITNYSPCKIAQLGIAYLMQEYVIFPKLSTLENVMTGFRKQEGESFFKLFFSLLKSNRLEEHRRNIAMDMLSDYHLQGREKQLACDLSIGEQKRVALARLNATGSDLLILDEPTAGLDPLFIKEMILFILNLKNQGKTIFLIDHDIDFVMRISDYIYVLNKGRLVAKGKPEEIKTNSKVVEAYLGN